MPGQWHVEILGGLRCCHTSENGAFHTIDRFHSQAASTLIAYLAYHPGPHAREVLVDLLWPNHDLGRGRSHLRVTLSGLRRLLEIPDAPDQFFLSDRHSIGLNTQSVTSDVAEFKNALRNAINSAAASDPMLQSRYLAQAVELYRGDLLPGHYEEWVIAGRQYLEESFFAALRQLIAQRESEGAWSQAVEYARRGLRIDALREDVQRDLMRCLVAAGQSAQALRQYRELERLLKTQLDLAPETATRLPATPATDETSPLPLQWTRFFGRKEEFSLCKTCWRTKRRGS